jgi:hypothetical protein
MGHNTGARPERMRIALLQARETAARDAEAVAIVEQWTAQLASGKRPLWSPTIEAAFRARRPWLRLYCPGCQQQYEIDLRKIVRPQDFPIMGLRAAMVCESMCRGGGPEPRLLGLERAPFDWSKRTVADER